MGARGFLDKKLGPTWGAVYRKSNIKNHFQDSKSKQSQKGILQEKHSDHKQSKSSTKPFVLRVEEDGEGSLLWSSWQKLGTQPENHDHKKAFSNLLLSIKKRIPVS